jgi:hypothetical protein
MYEMNKGKDGRRRGLKVRKKLFSPTDCNGSKYTDV